jgi:hypothetical protein
MVIKLRKMRWEGHIRSMICMACHRVFVLKPKKKPQFGALRHKWDDNFEMDVKDCGILVIESICLYIGTSGSRDSVVGTTG